MLYDFGMTATSMENRTAVLAKIAQLDAEMDLAMTAERFDEGLVLLADKLCWPLEDVAYLKKNHRRDKDISEITPASRKILKKYDFEGKSRFQKCYSDYSLGGFGQITFCTITSIRGWTSR